MALAMPEPFEDRSWRSARYSIHRSGSHQNHLQFGPG